MFFIFGSDGESNGAPSSGFRGTWSWLLGLGAAMTLLGAAAVAMSVLTSLMTMIFLGSLMLVCGVLQIAHAITLHRRNGYGLDLTTGLVYLIAGGVISFHPAATALAFAVMLSFFLVAGGVLRIAGGIMGSGPFRRRQLFYGALNLLLAYVIWHDWPVAGLSIIGLIIGVELLVSGLAVAMLGLTVRRALSPR